MDYRVLLFRLDADLMKAFARIGPGPASVPPRQASRESPQPVKSAPGLHLACCSAQHSSNEMPGVLELLWADMKGNQGFTAHIPGIIS